MGNINSLNKMMPPPQTNSNFNRNFW
jgi:hypothetical protein